MTNTSRCHFLYFPLLLKNYLVQFSSKFIRGLSGNSGHQFHEMSTPQHVCCSDLLRGALGSCLYPLKASSWKNRRFFKDRRQNKILFLPCTSQNLSLVSTTDLLTGLKISDETFSLEGEKSPAVGMQNL